MTKNLQVTVAGVPNLFEFKPSVHAARDFWEALMRLALQLARHRESRGNLILIDSGMTPERLREEWSKAVEVLDHDLVRRLNIINMREGEGAGFPHEPGEAVMIIVRENTGATTSNETQLPRPDYEFEILKVLVRRWLLNEGPVTTTHLMKSVGCSYPTAARALGQLGAAINRHSDRSIELRRFPRDEWARFLPSSSRLRVAVRFCDRSGQPRSPDALVDRLRRLNRPDLAVGGVAGARRWFPDLDVSGLPRLDVSVHCPQRQWNLDFVREIDPALGRLEHPDQGEVLVVHAVQRKDALSLPDSSAMIADPVECLLDLHEMRLEAQALEFVERLRSG